MSDYYHIWTARSETPRQLQSLEVRKIPQRHTTCMDTARVNS